ncbi:AAA domain-containing protein [Tsukamurella sp. 8F]|uniref:AAA domain-containing protein n=1 Tax=unclassified Tsukamurella TaxID=2633480 RepID=UPI0023BA1081|nr:MULTISPECIES: AAA domain-containing protein [unclassified Tsukamurella]MDF0531017.1 AAA domain-containing protein [Tsukamurella sp. 8J]MDF0588718.1 AAA domain-containing protein [Tsukamurella sp. 8F]
MTEGVGRGDDRRDKVLRMLQYLHDVVRARSTVVRDLDQQLAVIPLDGAESLGVRVRVEAAPGTEVFSVDSKSGEAYARLLRVYDELVEHPESLELVLASGLLTARDGDESIRAHLLTQPVILERDKRGRSLTLRLPRDSAPRIEDTLLLAGLDSFDLSGSAELQTELRETVRTVLDPKAASITTRWLGRASRAEGARVAPSPALVLRTRGAAPLVAFYDAMIRWVADEERPIPPGLVQLIEPVDVDQRLRMLAECGGAPPEQLVHDAHYVLPSNVEQRDILARMGTDSGVVVEGPPGTGKTHTIANLLSALLAKGQRVLVVSEKAHALAVLEDMLPPDLRKLVVSVLDVTTDGAASLAASINEIATRKSTFSEALVEAELRDLRGKRQQAVDRREDLLRRVWRLRASESEDSEWMDSGYSGRPVEIVERVRAEEPTYSWLPGPISGAVPPLDTQEFGRLVALMRRTSDVFAQRLVHNLPDLASAVPGIGRVEQLCAAVAEAPRGDGALAELTSVTDEARVAEIRRRADAAADRLNVVQRYPERERRLADQLLLGERAHVAPSVSALGPLLDEAVAADAELGDRRVRLSVVPDATQRRALDRYATHLDAGAAPRRRFRRPEQKDFEATGLVITVSGGAPGGDGSVALADLRAAQQHLTVEDAIGRIGETLSELGLDAPAADPRGQAGNRSARLSAAADELRRVQNAVGLVADRDSLVASLDGVGPHVGTPRDLVRLAGLTQSVLDNTGSSGGRTALAELASIRASVADIVERGPSPEGDELIAALETRDVGRIHAARRAWDVARRERDDRGALDLLALRLRTKAPALLDLLTVTSREAVWNDRIPQFADAWAWRRAATWVSQQAHPDDDARLEADLHAAEQDVTHYTTRIATAEAWQRCLYRITYEEIRALHAYRDHVANIGRGSGRHAERFRVAARDAMRRAQSAVPAWVMPISQVVASLPPEMGAFDVVIVDEASQADITSAFLLWLAPRVIVVGDEKQCAPATSVGVNLDQVFSRLDAQLPDIPTYLRDSLTPRSSLFTLLRTRFGSTVRLREHFRCMPEIIDFSSRQFYDDAPLVPVRHYGADRPPPLRLTRVTDGDSKGVGAKLVNPAEADAICEALAAAVKDPAYDGRTFGVIVLQGQAQVDELHTRLRAAVEPEEWDARRLRVGTPPDFQGDERDVILLSMVAGRHQRTISLTGRDFQRRFNVAASRARDQLWLFTSVSEEDLREQDLRRSLLEFVARGDVAVAPPMPKGVPTDRRVEPFASLFEQQVFSRLAAMGYHVNPKVTVNNRVVDMVVTGEHARLAVECDGSEFVSTAEQARSDIERERELRRCGWEFVRVRESVFRIDPDAAMSVVLAALDRRGVRPMTLQPALTAAEIRERDGSWQPVGLDIDTD